MARTKDRDGIQKLGPRHYRVVIELGKNADGERQRKHHTVRGTLEDAKAVRADLMAKRERGLYVERTNATVGSLFMAWLQEKSATVSPRTAERYRSLLGVPDRRKEEERKPDPHGAYSRLGGVRIQDLSRDHIQRFYNECLDHVSAATVRHRHVAVKQALESAVIRNLIPKNPAHHVALPRVESNEITVLEAEEAARLRKLSMGTSLDLPVLLALDTGMRLGEILALRWSDVDLEERRLSVRRAIVEQSWAGSELSFKSPKSNASSRTIDLSATTVAALKAHKKAQAVDRLRTGKAWQHGDLIVCNAIGEPVRPSTVSRHFAALTKRHGFSCRFHDLRHTHATLALAAGVPVHIVSKRLGHASPVITLQYYAGRLPHQDRECAEAVTGAIEKALAAL